MKKYIISCLVLIFANGCAQATLTGNIINVTVIKAQSSQDDAAMTGSDIEGLMRDLKSGEADITPVP